MLLGLDVSTSCTGFTVLDDNGKICELGAIDLKNKKIYSNMFSKAINIRNVLKMIGTKYNISHIYIEPALVLFQAGKSSATTISTLLKFNGIVSYICFEEFGKIPQYIPASMARKTCGIKIEKGSKAKVLTMEHWLKTEPDFSKIVEYTKNGNIKPEYFDISDSLTIVKAGYLLYEK